MWNVSIHETVMFVTQALSPGKVTNNSLDFSSVYWFYLVYLYVLIRSVSTRKTTVREVGVNFAKCYLFLDAKV